MRCAIRFNWNENKKEQGFLISIIIIIIVSSKYYTVYKVGDEG
jgi:hypothetical protein